MKYIDGIYRYKKISKLIFLVLVLTISCDNSMLEEQPKDFLTPSNAYSEPAYIEQGIIGLHQYARTWWTNNSSITTMVTSLGTDLTYYGEDPGGGLMTNYTVHITPTSRFVGIYWDYFYTMIQRANVLIQSIKSSDNSIWKNEAEKNSYLAEPMFFRAFSYRNIVALWGNAPVITEALDYVKTDYVRSPKAEIYKLIESDLLFAAANLPVKGKEKAPGRITQGAAWHLLSEIFLAQSKFQNAVEAATRVINDYGYALMTNRFGTKLGKDIFGTGDPYYDLFQLNNHNLSDNKEAIWVIQVEPLITGGGEYPGERMYGCNYYRTGNTPDGKVAFRGEFYNGIYTGLSDTLGRPVAWNRPTNYLAYDVWKKDWNKDIRNSKHNIKRDFYFDNPGSAYHGKKIDWKLYAPGQRASALRDTCQYIFPYFMKVATPLEHFVNLHQSGGGITHKDLYAMRLAETYLIRAEAYLGLNQKTLAAKDINEIRNRANATPVEQGEVTIEYILDERARELFTEEWRLITLMRLGKLVERVRKYNNNPVIPGLNIQDYNNLWPIPQAEIDLNIDAIFEQNPGY
jgi:starch-binding outer membrane protein, SusD/RagB family